MRRPDLSFGSKIVVNYAVQSDFHIFNSPPEAMTNKPPQKLTALIIDDETDICFLLSSILKQRNYQTVFARSLSEAEEILANGTDHSVIFLDNHLPDGLGVNNINRIKLKCPSSRIIMITAHDTTSDREKAQNEGVDSFIGKPFSKEIIFKTLESLSL